jgi:UDP-glucose 4-epimerase
LSSGTIENVDTRVDFHQLDIRDSRTYLLLRGLDAIIHLAAKSSLTDCLNDPLQAASVNVVGTVNMLEGARSAGVPKFVYADTSAEYEGISDFPTNENEVKPVSVYAASKHGGAAFCESYRRLYAMDITVVRYFNVYGPAQDWRRIVPPVMSAFIIRMLRGEQPIIYGDGEKRRDFIYVDDLNALHRIILEDPRAAGAVINAGTGQNYSINEIYHLVEDFMHTGLRPIYKPDLPGEAQVTLADISRARQLSWSPQVEMRDGLQRTIHYLEREMKQTLARSA